MDEKTIRTLVNAGGVKQIHIIADGGLFHVDIVTANKDVITALTSKGSIKTWSALDSAAKWVRSLGIGKAQVDIAHWRPGQRTLRI